jgi:glutamate dehydrogenase/leucine dehydrogenase
MNTEQGNKTIHTGVLGFGGLGQAAAKVLAGKRAMILVAAADQKGYAYAAEGLNTHE